MSKIAIVDLEVSYHLGVPEEERAQPQRLLVSVDLHLDFSSAAVSDRIERTINYYELSQDLLKFGENRSWKLIEKLVTNLAEFIMLKYKPQAVTVEVKKFPIPQARHIAASVTLTRAR